MAFFNAVLSVSTIPKVPHEHLPDKSHIIFQPVAIIHQFRIQRPHRVEFLANIFKDISRSEEHTSELQSLMRISYAVFCLKKKKTTQQKITTTINYVITIT